MMSGMQDPTYREAIEGKLQNLKNDPELEKIMAEIETGGPAAMMKCAHGFHRLWSVFVIWLLVGLHAVPQMPVSLGRRLRHWLHFVLRFF